MTAEDEMVTEQVLEYGFLDWMMALLEFENTIVREEMCFAATNIAAGTQEQCNKLISYQNGIILSQILKMGQYDKSRKVREEAIHLIGNVVHGCSLNGTKKIVELNGIQLLIDALEQYQPIRHHEIIQVALQSLAKMLEAAKKNSNYKNKICKIIEEHKGLDILEKIVGDVNMKENICKEAELLIKNYFNDNDNIINDANFNSSGGRNSFGFGNNSLTRNNFNMNNNNNNNSNNNTNPPRFGGFGFSHSNHNMASYQLNKPSNRNSNNNNNNNNYNRAKTQNSKGFGFVGDEKSGFDGNNNNNNKNNNNVPRIDSSTNQFSFGLKQTKQENIGNNKISGFNFNRIVNNENHNSSNHNHGNYANVHNYNSNNNNNNNSGNFNTNHMKFWF